MRKTRQIDPARTPIAPLRYLQRQLRNADRALARTATGRDAEALHDFRVAIRRIRSWLRILDKAEMLTRDEPVSTTLKNLARSTNPLRDSEIEITWTSHYVHTASPEQRQVINDLNRTLMRDFRAQLRSLRGNLQREWPPISARLRVFVRTHDWTDAARHIRIAQRRYRHDLNGMLRDVKTVNQSRTLHRARIIAKRLRYLLEPFETQRSTLRETIQALTKLQDEFGAFHDHEVLLERFKTRARDFATMRSQYRAVVRQLRREQHMLFDKMKSSFLGAHRRSLVHLLRQCEHANTLRF